MTFFRKSEKQPQQQQQQQQQKQQQERELIESPFPCLETIAAENAFLEN